MPTRSGRPRRVMTVRQYALATPAALGGTIGYERFCGVAAVRARPDGWGLLLCEDGDGRRATLATDDVGWVELLLLAHRHGGVEGLDLPPAKIAWRRDEWPDTWPDTWADGGGVTSPRSPDRP